MEANAVHLNGKPEGMLFFLFAREGLDLDAKQVSLAAVSKDFCLQHDFVSLGAPMGNL